MPKTVYVIVPIVYAYNDEHSYPENYDLPVDGFTCPTKVRAEMDRLNIWARANIDVRNENDEPYIDYYKIQEIILHD